ncbi:MAG: LLM class flavin-dependent oxidoreductase [Caldilineaceae bacterium]
MKIGVVINHMANPATGAPPSYAEMRQVAQASEAGGIDSIWLFDHLLFRYTADTSPAATVGIWECWTLLSALAEATNRVELGTLVLCNPFRNPALLAKMAHTLDEVSGGRVILGMGAGWHQPEFDAFGYDFSHRVDRFEEALQIVKPLLHGERVDFQGDHYQVQNCVITPLGPRPAGIPLLVGAGQPRMLRLVARYADQWNTAWLGTPTALPERLTRIQAACADMGRDPATLAITVGVQVAFPDLGKTNSLAREPLTGSAAELADAFDGYEQAGAAHLIINPTPYSLTAVERVTEAVRLYRGN